MDVVIVGAGIGGLVAAASLLKQGHRVRVLEQAEQIGEVGAAVQLSANAVKVLYNLGLKGTLETGSVKPKAFEFRRYDTGEMLYRIELGEAHEQKHGAPYYQIHRVDLHASLSELVQSLDAQAIVLQARVVAVEEYPDRAVAVLADGRRYECEVLIGGDGIKSVVRQHVLDQATPVFTGQVAWRLAVPTAQIPPELCTDIVSTIWCGPKNHAVMYYMRSGTLLNFVGCVERPQEEESWTQHRPWEELDQDYAGWHPMVRAVIDRADRNHCYRWALNIRHPAMEWSTARVTLLGDAVHPTLPYMAQGAAMAIEDAAVLTRALAMPLPLAEALQRYSQHRAPRTARVVQESNEMGELYHIDNADEMRQAFKDRNIAHSRNTWLYPYDPLRVEIA